MKIETPGMKYLLTSQQTMIPDRPIQFATTIVPPHVGGDAQEPVMFAIDGVSERELLEVLIDRVEYLNRTKPPSSFYLVAVQNLQRALDALNFAREGK